MRTLIVILVLFAVCSFAFAAPINLQKLHSERNVKVNTKTSPLVQNDTDIADIHLPHFLCGTCKGAIGDLVEKLGCGHSFIDLGACLDLVETVVGAVICAAFVEIGNTLLKDACDKFTHMNEIKAKVGDAVCKKAHLC